MIPFFFSPVPELLQKLYMAESSEGRVISPRMLLLLIAVVLLLLLQALINNWTTGFLRADSQQGAAEFTIAHRKRGRVVLLF